MSVVLLMSCNNAKDNSAETNTAADFGNIKKIASLTDGYLYLMVEQPLAGTDRAKAKQASYGK